jgi:hypothetical protein
VKIPSLKQKIEQRLAYGRKFVIFRSHGRFVFEGTIQHFTLNLNENKSQANHNIRFFFTNYDGKIFRTLFSLKLFLYLFGPFRDIMKSSWIQLKISLQSSDINQSNVTLFGIIFLRQILYLKKKRGILKKG